MAYQTRGRDPLLDSTTALALEKRGKELLGLSLIVLAVLSLATVFSYHPEDPNWMSASDAGAQNWMGRTGASVIAPLMMIAGLSVWALAILPGVWGLRFLLHRGSDRAAGRLILAPVWVAVVAMYWASLTPGADWMAAHSFGLGGLFGDMILGTVLGIMPFDTGFSLRLLSVIFGVTMLGLGGFVLGFTKREVSDLWRGFVIAMVGAYATVLGLLGQSAQGTMRLSHSIRRVRAEIAANHGETVVDDAQPGQGRVRRSADVEAQDMYEAEPVSPGLIGRLSRLRGAPDLAMHDDLNDVVDSYDSGEMQSIGGDARIRDKIVNAVKSRVRQDPELRTESHAPLTKGRGRGPDPLIVNASAAGGVRQEPPLTADTLRDDMFDMQVSQAFTHDNPQAIDAEFSVSPDEMAAAMPTAAPAPKKVVQHNAKKPAAPSRRAMSEAQPSLQFDAADGPKFELPPLSLLSNPVKVERHQLSDEALEENARMLENVLDDYGVKGEIVSVRPGPVVTMYELEPAPGLKASRVIGLADDIARSMSALSARVSTVPGRSVIGIELPNENREMVALREILATKSFGDSNVKLPLALGKDIGGEAMVASLAKMPHLLIAGTTGSGKSVAINTMILSLLYSLTPDECRLIMIDPKMLELSVYDGIPHLLSPVVTDPKKAVVALKWVVAEMEERYRKMSKMGVRNIDGYNGRVADALAKDEMFSRTVQTGFDDETGDPVFETEEFAPEKMPYIVVIVDEMADLMMVAGKEIEACIQRLAQMARASGIHLIMATQRPSVDVITGTIKANFPTRISFQVTSKIDSRTILGEMGAEQLLGMGDMLYMAGGGKISRCHGPFVSDEEVEEVVNCLKSYGAPEYVSGVQDGPEDEKASNIDAVLGLGGNTNGEDALYDQAVQIAITDRKCSTSYIQRKLAIGYNKAARLVEQMEDEGVVSAANHVGKREILVPEQN